MQDVYTGDIGDFAKYALLRAISHGKRLGVAWYLHPSPQVPTGNGQHLTYLNDPDTWRGLDPTLFETLAALVGRRDRSTAAIEKTGVLGRAVFANESLDVRDIPFRDRERWRQAWFRRVVGTLKDCDLVFADPDNGLYPTEHFKPTRKESAKRISLVEATELADQRTAVVYHHNTRRRGGHKKEINHWMRQLPNCRHAWYWRRWSCRTFFILNAEGETERQLGKFTSRWEAHGELIRAPV